jgi:hypothetical protein
LKSMGLPSAPDLIPNGIATKAWGRIIVSCSFEEGGRKLSASTLRSLAHFEGARRQNVTSGSGELARRPHDMEAHAHGRPVGGDRLLQPQQRRRCIMIRAAMLRPAMHSMNMCEALHTCRKILRDSVAGLLDALAENCFCSR